VDRGLAFVQSSFFSFLLFVVSIVYCGAYLHVSIYSRHISPVTLSRANNVLPTAHPSAKPASSPPKPHPPTSAPTTLIPVAIPTTQSQKPHLQPRTPSKNRNPFARQPSDVPPHELGTQSSSSVSPFTLIPIVSSSSNPTEHPQKVTHTHSSCGTRIKIRGNYQARIASRHLPPRKFLP